MSNPMRLTRALVDRLPPRTATQILLELDQPATLWVFAVGSLIWSPRFEVAERRAARVIGWRRSFCLGPDRRFRGSPSAPGIMLSLDRGGECQGVVLLMQPSDLHTALVALMKAEPPVPPQWVHAETDAGPVNAIAFTADPTSILHCPEPPLEELADLLASSVGFVGTMAEYLLNTITELEKAGIHDPHLWQLQTMVAERLERLRERVIESKT